jgi:hypothetical protein
VAPSKDYRLFISDYFGTQKDPMRPYSLRIQVIASEW